MTLTPSKQNSMDTSTSQPELTDCQERQRTLELDQLRQYRQHRESKTVDRQQMGRASQTDGGKGLRYLIVPVLIAELERHNEWLDKQPNRAGVAIKQYRRVKSWMSTATIAHISLSVILDSLGRGYSLGSSYTELVIEIGKQLEDDAFMAYMEVVSPKYFEKLTEWYLNDPVRRYDKKVYAMRRALENNAEMQWDWMTEKDHAALGAFIFSRVMMIRASKETDKPLFEIRQCDFDDPKNKKRKRKHEETRYIGFSTVGITKRDELQKAADHMTWKPMPMVCKPLPWSITTTTDEDGNETHDIERGGYINRMPGIARELIHHNKGSVPSEMVLDSLNRLQNTGYKVNTYILDLQHELMRGTWEIDGFITYEATSYEDEFKPIYTSEYLDSLDPESDEHKKAMRELTNFYKNQKIDEKKADNPRRTTKLAEMFRDEPAIYTPWFLDTRGRLYPVVEGLSPQGPDYQKALLRSAKSVPVNEDTRRDLLISIATACAEKGDDGIGIDKKDYFERLVWAEKFVQSDYCRAMVDYPMTYRRWMEKEVDEPFQFLAFCKEYYDIFVDEVKDTTDVFVFRDATNSGLQILAGLMRDEKSAFYTNVLVTEAPQDAYRLVAESAKDLMRNESWMAERFQAREEARLKKNKKRDKDDQIEARGNIFDFDIDVLNRNHTKTQVMTTLYNSSPLTRRENILSALKKKDEVELHPGDKGIVVGACISAMASEFEKALELNTWFQDVARAAMEDDKEHLKWITPSGMYVVNEYRQPLYTSVKTYAAGGGHYARLMSNDQGYVWLQHGYGEPKISKVLSSTSANYIHSLDSAIIHLGLLKVPAGLPVFTVHDCIACLPGTVSDVVPVFRQAYHNVVTSEPLMGLLEENDLAEVLQPPTKGDADISQCLDSPYFFC